MLEPREFLTSTQIFRIKAKLYPFLENRILACAECAVINCGSRTEKLNTAVKTACR
jgi:hypothetical protein